MITNLNIGKDGRLGNQLYQYAALKSLSLENNYECVLPEINNTIWHGQVCLLQNFNLKCKFEDTILIDNYYQEKSISDFDKNFFDISDNTSIRGFFQNKKYFEKYKDIICNELKTNDIFQSEADEILKQYRDKFSDYEFVSLHIRRGDNLNVNSEMGKRLFGGVDYLDYNSMFGRYIKLAIDKFKNKKVKFFVFTGGNRDNNDEADNQWIRKSFDSDNFISLCTNDPLIDYTLISKCDHNILSHVTTFGWWAAYVNENSEKLMIAPKNYFTDNTDSSRIFDENFILI